MTSTYLFIFGIIVSIFCAIILYKIQKLNVSDSLINNNDEIIDNLRENSSHVVELNSEDKKLIKDLSVLLHQLQDEKKHNNQVENISKKENIIRKESTTSSSKELIYDFENNYSMN
jgi:hypothetical protein